MIEPFEFETIRLSAPSVTREQKDVPVKSSGTVDFDLSKGISSFHNSMNDLKMDMSRQRVFQTKLGNPMLESQVEAQFQNDRVVGKGPLVVGGNEPAEVSDTSVSSSELFHRYLDVEATFVPSISKHILPTMSTIGLDSPSLYPGLTNVDSRKLNIAWHS